MEMQPHRCKVRSVLAATLAVSTVSVLQQNDALAQGAPKLEESVVFAMPGGPGQETLAKCAADDFTKKANVHVEFLSVPDAQVLAKLLAQSGSRSIDVVWATASTNYTGLKRGVYMETNASLVPNIANVNPRFDVKPGEGALASTSIQGITYNTKIFAEKGWDPPKSWKDLWDPKYKGRVAIYGMGGASGPALLAVAGYLAEGSAENFDAAFDYITKLKPNLYGTIFANGPQNDVALKNGDVIIGIGTQSRALAMKLAGDPVGFVQPVEGVVLQNIFLSVVKEAPHPNAALAFVNWMLSKEGQSCVLSTGYPAVIDGVKVDPELAPFLAFQGKVIPTNWPKFQDNLPALVFRWNKEIAG